MDLPPQGCPYLSPADVHQIIDGLPPGTTIRVGAEHVKFFGITRSPGGSLGGEVETFNSWITLHLEGTGDIAGFDRSLGMPAMCETHVAPRIPGDPVQSFAAEMFAIQGQLPGGDPDFDLLRITAGTGFGLPSPGNTTLTRLPGGTYNVESFFDITYRIDFVGAPGGALAGMSGSTTGTIRMATGEKLFIRADANSDRKINIADPVYTLSWLFIGGPAPSCMDAADANDDGKTDIGDPIYSLMYQFTGGAQPPPPFPLCGPDPTVDNLGCESYTCL